jgi:hypothetical protein
MGRKNMRFYTKIDNSVGDNRRYYFFEWGRYRIVNYADNRILFQLMPKEPWKPLGKEAIKCFALRIY